MKRLWTDIFLCTPCEIFVSFGVKLAAKNTKNAQGTQRKNVRALLFLLIYIVLAESAAADSWGANLFPTKRHDFGQVTLGANAEFRFELKNIYDSDLRLVSLRSSCSCTSAQFSTSLLKPGATGAVIVRFNTSGQHLRSNSSVLSVQLETAVGGIPRTDMVQLFVSGYIRPDVLLTPGSVEFGAVPEGTSVTRTLLLEYTGRPGWALMGIKRSLPFIYARAEELRRERGDVTYRITAILTEDAPSGYVRDILRFTTNELPPGRTEPVEITLPVQGVVTAAMQTKPSPIQIGILAPGETTVKNIIIRSDTPFRITNVSASDNRFRFAFSDQASTIQLVSVSFSARQVLPGQSLGAINVTEVIRISTNDPQQNSISINAFGRIIHSVPP